jgi:hypothetical protein
LDNYLLKYLLLAFKKFIIGCMPVISATQQAEIRRIALQSQSRQIVQETLFQKYLTQRGAGRVA